MEYPNDLLALFPTAPFPQQGNPDWLQPGSNLPGTSEGDNEDSFEETAFQYSPKTQTSYLAPENYTNCASRHPSNFSGPFHHNPSIYNASMPISYSQQHAQYAMVDDTAQTDHPYGHEADQKQPLLASQSYSEPSINTLQHSGNPTRRSSHEAFPDLARKRQRMVHTRTNSSSSSTRRNSSLPTGPPNGPCTPNIDHYSNYTTSSPCKPWPGSAASPTARIKHLPSMYLGYYEGPKYRNDGPKRYELVRGIASGQVTRPPYSSSKASFEYIPVELNVQGAQVNEINERPWSYEEQQDGRRIIRMERRQRGHVISARFSVVGSALEHPTPEKAPAGVKVVEVSCLNYVSQEDEDNGIRYSITSVEVVNIIEALISSTTMTSGSLRKEKGRIRSNLMPFWSKKPLSSKKAVVREVTDSRTDFARRIMRYDIRKPRGFDKDVRILSWEKLVPALHRAMQCYYAEVPKDDLLDSTMEDKSFSFEKAD
ncbi:hypothetical protein OXX79_006828 [Metschnikowia pulcherrima]